MRRILIGIVLAILAAGGFASSPASANIASAPTRNGSSEADTRSAAEVTAATLATCAYDIGYTIKDGYYIKGSGSMTKCYAVWHIRIYLQRGRWWGWQTLNHVDRWTTGASSVGWYCRGAGTYTYRTLIYAWNYWGSPSYPSYKISNYLRVRC